MLLTQCRTDRGITTYLRLFRENVLFSVAMSSAHSALLDNSFVQLCTPQHARPRDMLAL